MPIVYVSGKARQSLPFTSRWSLRTMFTSPPIYCAGVCTCGSKRLTTASLNRWSSMRFLAVWRKAASRDYGAQGKGKGRAAGDRGGDTGEATGTREGGNFENVHPIVAHPGLN